MRVTINDNCDYRKDIIMELFKKIKNYFSGLKSSNKKSNEALNFISIESMEAKYTNGDLMGAAKDLKSLLEAYGKRKSKNHHYKGRVFISFLLSNKHQDLKNTGYNHWENLTEYIRLNHSKVYPYHQKNIREAMTFFEKEIKGLAEIKIPVL